MSSTTTKKQALAIGEARTKQTHEGRENRNGADTAPESAKISKFASVYGNGVRPKHLSRAHFMTRAADGAVEDLNKVGRFLKTSGGELYFCQEQPDAKIIPLTSDDVRFRSLINRHFKINAASGDVFNHIITAAQMHAYENGKVADVYQFAHVDRDTKTAYVSFLDGAYMLKLTGSPIPERVPIGTDGVFFANDVHCEPWTLAVEEEIDHDGQAVDVFYDKGAAKQYLVDPIEFTDTEHLSREDQQWLFEVWIRSQFLDLTEKPLVLLYGVPGSGKTLALQRVKKALFGANADVDSASTEDAFTAAVSNNSLVVLDNIDRSYSKWLADNLAKASTGVSFNKRALYTTNTQVTFPARAAIGLTAFAPSFIENGPDLADRTLVFGLSRVKGDFKGRGEAFRLVREHRDEILTDLALATNEYIRFWRKQQKEETSPLRMADFGILLQNYAKMEKQEDRVKKVFSVLQKVQTDLLAEHDSLVMGIQEWREKHPGEDYEGTAGDIAKTVFELTGVRHTAGSIGRKINAMWAFLEKKFGAKKKPGRSRYMRYRFSAMESVPQEQAGELVKIGEHSQTQSSPDVNVSSTSS
jgi:hypothetical protein